MTVEERHRFPFGNPFCNFKAESCRLLTFFPGKLKNNLNSFSEEHCHCLQALLKMKRELRSKMEREIGELQKIIVENDEDDHFQDLEVQRLRNRVQMASFQYNTSYLH